MRSILSIPLILVASALVALPAIACDFKASNGSTVRFLGPEAHPYASIDGKKCTFTNSTFTCGGKTTSYEDKWDRFAWQGQEYVTTDNCALDE